jgi:serine/threonine protein kinase
MSEPADSAWRAAFVEVIDPVCDAFEHACKEGRRPVIEDHLGAVPEAARPLLAAELLRIELEWRCRHGERPAVDEYRPRFPAFATALDTWLDEAHAAAAGTPLPPSTNTPADLTPTCPTHPGGGPRRIGEYELLEPLGAGGMGEVFKARHRRLGKLVALKLLPVGSHSSADRVARFLREIQAVGSLNHPNVIEAHDAGEEAGVVYLAMKLVEGEDLGRLVQRGGPLPVAQACELARQAALGLQYLHERGLIHRDVKPTNLMRTPEGAVKVLDLGLARWQMHGAGELTAAEQLLGTPDFLAPEQVRDAAAADLRADLYGLGGTLFYLLTGRAPFAHHLGLYGKLDAHRSEAPPDVRSLRPEVPPPIADLLGRLLAKEPRDRPQSAAEVAAALAEFAEPMTTYQPPPPKKPPLQRRDWRKWLAAAVVLVGLLGLTSWAWRNRTPTDYPRAPEAKPLTVRWKVMVYGPEADNSPLLGELGENRFRTRLNYRVSVVAQLSEPAYAYLIAFNPAVKPEDQEHHFPRKAGEQPPEPQTRLSPDKWLRLNDGVGLQALAVVASRQPLLPYAEWRKTRPPLPWALTKATPRVVWQGDGKEVIASYEPGWADRGSEEDMSDKAAIRALARMLKELPGVDAVSVFGFAVDQPE